MTGYQRLSEEKFHTEELRPGAWSFVVSFLLFVAGAVSGILANEFLLEPVSPYVSGGNNWQLVLAAMLLGWLLLLPLIQYLLLRFVSGARPRLAWSALVPNVFSPFRVVGHRFDRRTFALACAVPFFVALDALSTAGYPHTRRLGKRCAAGRGGDGCLGLFPQVRGISPLETRRYPW